MEQKSFAPTAANYKALLDRTSAAMQSFAAHEINLHAFTAELQAIELETRALNLVLRMNRTLRNLAKSS